LRENVIYPPRFVFHSIEWATNRSGEIVHRSAVSGEDCLTQ